MNFDVRGHIGTVKEINVGGITTKLKPKYRHQVLVLDTVDKDLDYTLAHSVDSLNSLGWCKFDDVAEFFGADKAQELVKFCEKKLRERIKSEGNPVIPSEG